MSKRWYMAWVSGVIALIADQICRAFGAYSNSSYWLYDAGVPMEATQLLYQFPLLIAVVVGTRLAAGNGNVLSSLGFREPLGRGLGIGLAIALPSFLVGPPTSFDCELWPSVNALLVTPITRPAFFAALLIAIPVRLAKRRFWPTAVCASIAHGSYYMP